MELSTWVFPNGVSLVTQAMLQHRLNYTELRSILNLFKFQNCKQKVPPPSLLSNEKEPITPTKEDFSHPWGVGWEVGCKG